MYVTIAALSVLLLAVLLWLTTFAAVLAVRVMRGENRRRMLSSCSCALCDGTGRAGITAICSDVCDLDSICGLLAVEYEHYELVVVVDACRSPELLRELVERYALVSVDVLCPDAGALPGVTHLYRSRRRRFKRLAVACVTSVSAGADADAVLDIAVYDYVMPVFGDIEVLPFAVERLAAEICLSPRRPHEVHAAVGADLAVYTRDDVIAGGGFAGGAASFCRRRDAVFVYETLAVDRARHRAGAFFGGFSFVVTLCASGVLSLVLSSLWPLVATALAWAAFAASVYPAVRCTTPHLRGLPAYIYTFRCFCEKILLKISQ